MTTQHLSAAPDGKGSRERFSFDQAVAEETARQVAERFQSMQAPPEPASEGPPRAGEGGAGPGGLPPGRPQLPM